MLEAHDAQEYPPCVIYLHGNCGSRCDANDAVKLLLPQGIAVCCFDFSGSGYSEGDHISLGVRWVPGAPPRRGLGHAADLGPRTGSRTTWRWW